jgi:uncharacterized membrane protein
MNPFQRRQRGEGKIGCIVTMLVLVVVAAVAIKAVPVFWSDNELKDAAKDLASRASVTPVENIELQLRTKARQLEIAEAMAPGALKAYKTGDNQQGTCRIHLRYDRKVDLYGTYTWVISTDTDISAPYINGM